MRSCFRFPSRNENDQQNKSFLPEEHHKLLNFETCPEGYFTQVLETSKVSPEDQTKEKNLKLKNQKNFLYMHIKLLAQKCTV